MIEGYSFNDKLIAVAVSPFSKGNLDHSAIKNAPEEVERMMGFMFIIAGEAEFSIDYQNYKFSENSWVELRPSADVKLLNHSSNFNAYIIMAAESFILDTLLDKKPIPVSHFVDARESPHMEITDEEMTALKPKMKVHNGGRAGDLLYGESGCPQQYFGMCHYLSGNPVVCGKSGNLLKYY